MKGEPISNESLLPSENLRAAVVPGMTGVREKPAGLLTVAQAAELLNVSANTVRGLCQARRLRHQRIGLGRGAIRIAPEALEEYQRSVTVEAGQGTGKAESARKPCRVIPMSQGRISLG